MAEHTDPFEILAALDPLEPAPLASAHSSLRAQATLERILAEPPTSRHRSRPRHIYALAAATTAIAAAGAAWALTNTPTHRLEVGCYASTSLDAKTVIVGATHASAVATCRALWRQGEIGRRTPQHLHACLLPSGAIGVFPGRCQTLKLAPAILTQPPSSRGSPNALKRSLVQTYLSHRCLDRSAALAATRAAIRHNGPAGWNAKATTPFTAQRRCSSFAFDELRRLVLIIPVPPRR